MPFDELCRYLESLILYALLPLKCLLLSALVLWRVWGDFVTFIH